MVPFCGITAEHCRGRRVRRQVSLFFSQKNPITKFGSSSPSKPKPASILKFRAVMYMLQTSAPCLFIFLNKLAQKPYGRAAGIAAGRPSPKYRNRRCGVRPSAAASYFYPFIRPAENRGKVAQYWSTNFPLDFPTCAFRPPTASVLAVPSEKVAGGISAAPARWPE